MLSSLHWYDHSPVRVDSSTPRGEIFSPSSTLYDDTLSDDPSLPRPSDSSILVRYGCRPPDGTPGYLYGFSTSVPVLVTVTSLTRSSQYYPLPPTHRRYFGRPKDTVAFKQSPTKRELDSDHDGDTRGCPVDSKETTFD